MKKKALNVNNILLLLSSLLLVFISDCQCSIDLITSSDSESDSSANQLSSQSSRTSSPSESSYEKFFYQTTNGGLPLDKEVTVFVLSGEAKRLYYQIHESKPEIALTVTPCESSIEWKLSFLPQKLKERKAKNRKRYKRRHSKYVDKNLLNNLKPILLTTYVGNERNTYSDVSSSSGLYIIDFNSMGKDVSAKIFVSQHYPYPLLPNEPDIRLISVKEDQVLINWQMSPSEAVTPIEYCVSISTGNGLADNCLLDSYLKDPKEEEYELDLLPSSAATTFTYWWGKTVKNMLRQTKLKALADSNVRIECLGKKTWHLLDRLDNKYNNQYFIDIYAKNSITNATSIYRTLNVTLINTEPIEVTNNEQIVIRLNKTNNFTQLLNYKNNGSSGYSPQKFWFFLKSCSGLGPISITARTIDSNIDSSHLNSSLILFSKTIFDMKTLDVTIDKNITNKSILFEVNSRITSDRNIVFLMSQRHNRFPFPLLPEDTRIRVMETLTDCQSVTLAWNASPDERVMYCIYEMPALNHFSSIEDLDSVCTENRLISSSDETINANPVRKVLCKRYQKSSKRRFNNKIIQTIKKLSSGQKYLFQVMITKNRGRTLAYEQVWVSTKAKYQCQ